jgi:ribonuclease P protein subunit POP4
MISSNNIFYHELIGLELKVVDSSNASLIGIRGTVVDETKKTFLIEAEPRKICENIKAEPGKNATIQESSNLSSRSTGSFIRNDVAINSDSALKLIPKDVSIFEFKVPDGTIVEIDGKILLNRPEDRIKKRYKKF